MYCSVDVSLKYVGDFSVAVCIETTCMSYVQMVFLNETRGAALHKL